MDENGISMKIVVAQKMIQFEFISVQPEYTQTSDEMMIIQILKD